MYMRFKKKLPAIAVIISFLALWWAITQLKIVPEFMLPGPAKVGLALASNLPVLLEHSMVTLFETICGLSVGIILAFLVALLMDRYKSVQMAFRPILVATQSVPTVVVAPILVLLLGYGTLPKVVLVALCCFFPIAVALADGLRHVNVDYLRLFKALGASRTQTLIHLKLPMALPQFFSGLAVSAAYAFISAVTAEWLGGSRGLGVYMTRVKSAYAFDKLYACVIFIVLVSLAFTQGVNALRTSVLQRFHIINTGNNA